MKKTNWYYATEALVNGKWEEMGNCIFSMKRAREDEKVVKSVYGEATKTRIVKVTKTYEEKRKVIE